MHTRTAHFLRETLQLGSRSLSLVMGSVPYLELYVSGNTVDCNFIFRSLILRERIMDSPLFGDRVAVCCFCWMRRNMLRLYNGTRAAPNKNILIPRPPKLQGSEGGAKEGFLMN